MKRIGAAATANTINGVIGGGGATAVTLGIFWIAGATPPGLVLLGVGIVGATIFDVSPYGQGITQTVFKAFGADIPRQLRRLNIP